MFSKLISSMKGEPFQIDKDIPISYLAKLMVNRIMMALRGMVRFRKVIYVGENTKVKCKKRITVGKNVTIGENCYIDALSRDGINLGNNVSIQKNTSIECTGSVKHLGKGLIVGNNVGIGSNSFLGCAGGIEIGDDVIIGNAVSFHAESHVFKDDSLPIRLQGVTRRGIRIGKNCWIGAKAVILDGAVIENGCIIAAGAVVTAGIYKQNSIYGGVPARIIKSRVTE